MEGAGGVGAPLTRRLRADGIQVIDVPAKLATRVRLLSTGHGHKNDDSDALSVGVAALTSTTPNTAETDGVARAIVDHRDDPRCESISRSNYRVAARKACFPLVGLTGFEPVTT